MTGKGADDHPEITESGLLGARHTAVCFLIIGEVCVHGFHVHSFNQRLANDSWGKCVRVEHAQECS